jgi:hypothetical protein
VKPLLVAARRVGALRAFLLASLPTGALLAQTPTPPEAAPAPALLVSAIAGQKIPVLPLTYVVVDDSIRDAAIQLPRTALLAWADSIVAEAMLARAPEVTWILGSELRRKVRAAPGMLPEPGRMGQAALRFVNVKRIPEPLFGYLRTLVALADGRLVLVPASLRLTAAEGGVRAETMFVLADARSGAVIWRSSPVVVGKTAAEALRATVAYILPDAR